MATSELFDWNALSDAEKENSEDSVEKRVQGNRRGPVRAGNFNIGDAVQIVHLRSKLVGKVGKVVGYDNCHQRYRVDVGGFEQGFLTKNLKLAQSDTSDQEISDTLSRLTLKRKCGATACQDLETQLQHKSRRILELEHHLDRQSKQIADLVAAVPPFWVEVQTAGRVHMKCRRAVQEVLAGFALGFAPERLGKSTCGVFRLDGPDRRPVAAFKPLSLMHVPRDILLEPEEMMEREVAAHVLNRKVPPTTVAAVRWKGDHMVGMFQCWVDADPLQDLVDTGKLKVEDLRVQSVQEVCAFDIQIGQMDRNLGNVLGQDLVYIDHSLAFPKCAGLKDGCRMPLLSCVHAKQPIQPNVLDQIARMDAHAQLAQLKVAGVKLCDETCLRFTHRTELLQDCALNQGMTLNQVAELLYTMP